MKKIPTLIVMIASMMYFSACSQDKKQVSEQKISLKKSNMDQITKVEKTEDEWKKELTPTQYHVLREKGTERPFSSEMVKNDKKGVYKCAACQLPLFLSDTKFKSGTGWPSFYEPIDEKNVGKEADASYGMVRTEVHCARCDGHLGHIFNDGPKPTGLRYCINAVSLSFQQSEGK